MTAPTFYSSAAAVRTRTGVDPSDLGFDEAESDPTGALTGFLEELLTEASDLMNRVMRRSYLAAGGPSDAGEDDVDDSPSFPNTTRDPDEIDFAYTGAIPPGLNGIAADVVADWVRTMVMTRQTPVVRIDDFAVKTVSSRTLTDDIKNRLKLYAKGRGAVSVDVGEDQLAPLPDILTAASLGGMDQLL